MTSTHHPLHRLLPLLFLGWLLVWQNFTTSKISTDKISRDTEHASYAMTQINTEVLNIRADISKEVSKDGFKAVGDLAMEEDWEDGSIEKTLAHAAIGAAVAAIGNGDALSGAVGAGAAEAARPATKDADDATQQTVSAVVGAIAGGGTGASTGLDGEKYNRQLHQREIAWIKEHAEAFAQANGMSQKDAQLLLTMSALGMVDAQNSATIQQMIRNGTISQSAVQSAQNYIKGHAVGETFHDEHHYDDSFGHDQGLFTVNREQFFDHSYDPNTMKAGAVPVSPLDYLPAGRGVGAAFRGAGKGNVGIIIDKSWKDKIQGTAQKTGTPGHAIRIYREAIDAAKDPTVKSVHLDHGYNRALDLPPKTVQPNRRPDVTIVHHDNTVRRTEVQSKTDKEKILRERNDKLDPQLIEHGYKPEPTEVVVPTTKGGN